MKIIEYKVISKVQTSSTSLGYSGSIIGEITVVQEKTKTLFSKSTKTQETFKIIIKYINQSLDSARRVDNGFFIYNEKFSKHITDLFNHEINKNKLT